MSTQDPGRTPATPPLTALPRLEDIPRVGEGYDPERVREAFESFRRHTTQLQAQLRVLQASGRSANVEPTGHSVRMDALHLIRAAAEFADTLERDAQTASATQLRRTEQEVRRRQEEVTARAGEVERYRQESERQRAEILNAARNEARELLASANRDASQELREAEARAARLLEQARHQATELANAARAEVEQTLEWARAQAGNVMARAQQGAEQLLRAAGLGDDRLNEVVDAIMTASTSTEPVRAARRPTEGLSEPPPMSGAPADVAPDTASPAGEGGLAPTPGLPSGRPPTTGPGRGREGGPAGEPGSHDADAPPAPPLGGGEERRVPTPPPTPPPPAPSTGTVDAGEGAGDEEGGDEPRP